MKALKRSLSTIAARKEIPEEEDESYEYETDSEKEFSPLKEGTEIPNDNLPEPERKNAKAPQNQKKRYTEEKRRILVIKIVKKGEVTEQG